MSTITTDGLSVDALMQIRDSIDEEIAAKAAKPVVEETTEVTKTVKVKKPSKKAAKKARRKAKAKKAKNKVVTTTKKVTRKGKRKSASGWRKFKSGVRKGWRASKRGVARAAKWTWSKVRWGGRKLAGAGSWVIQGGARLVRWAIGGIGWGWALVGAAGLIILGLVAWGVSSGAEAAAAPLAWAAAGRPSSLKKFKSKREAKRLKKRSKLLRDAKKAAQKRVSKLDKELKQTEKAATKAAQRASRKQVAVVEPKAAKAEAEKTKVISAPVEEVEETTTTTTTVLEHEDVPTPADIQAELDERAKRKVTKEATEDALIMVIGQENYTDLSDDDIIRGLALRWEKLNQEGAPKDAYSMALGRFETAKALREDKEELRGKPLYQKLQTKVIDSYGGVNATRAERRKLADKDIMWNKFQAGVIKEQELLESYPADEAQANA